MNRGNHFRRQNISNSGLAISIKVWYVKVYSAKPWIKPLTIYIYLINWKARKEISLISVHFSFLIIFLIFL